MISVVIPVKDVECYLEQCLSSVLTQSYKDIEVICVNDGSTDRSSEILKKFSQRDSRLILISHPQSMGISVARNVALEIAKGEFITFIDSDDYLLPGALERMVNLMTPDVDAVVSAVKYVYEDAIRAKEDNQLGHYFTFRGKMQLSYENLFQFNQAVFPKLYRRERVKRLGLRFPNGLLWEDNLWHWIYFSGQPVVYFDSTPAYCYRKHRVGSIMSSVFNKSTHRLPEHFDVYRLILEFYKGYGLIDQAGTSLVKLLENFLLFCLQNASLKDGATSCYKCKEILDDFSLDTSSSWILTRLKSENCHFFLITDSDLDFVIKINKMSELLFPEKSRRRYLLSLTLRKMRKLVDYFS